MDLRELEQNNHGLRGLAILEFEAWSFGGLEVTNVSRIVALGGSICRILRGLEAPGGPTSNHAVRPGGSAKENKHSRMGGPRLGWLAGWLAG